MNKKIMKVSNNKKIMILNGKKMMILNGKKMMNMRVPVNIQTTMNMRRVSR
jgi:hypothetical protein